MPETVPTLTDHEALAKRVKALEGAPPVEPPEEPPEEGPPPVEPPEPPPEVPPAEGIVFIRLSEDGDPDPDGFRKRHIQFRDDPGTRFSGTASPGFYFADSHDWRSGDQTFDNWWYELRDVNGQSFKAGKQIDTTKYPDGQYSLTVRFDPLPADVDMNSQVIIINNSGNPILSDRHIFDGWFRSYSPNAISAPARANIASPIRHHFPQLRAPKTDAERDFLHNEALWAVDHFTAGADGLYQGSPELWLNNEGDSFMGDFRARGKAPEVPGGSITKEHGRAVERHTSVDGPRGIATVSPYSTLFHTSHIGASGHMGFGGIEAGGRFFRIDLDGTVETLFGPRNVPGVTPRNPYINGWDLERRIAEGEKEFVGDFNQRLKIPNDAWENPEDIENYYIADFGNNRVVEIDTRTGGAVGQWYVNAPKSVWSCHQMRAEGIRFCAAGADGAVMYLMNKPEPVIDYIPNASWVRGKEFASAPDMSRAYIMTDTLAFYESDFRKPNDPPKLVSPPKTGIHKFSAFDLDANGVYTGKRGGIVFFGANSWNSNTAFGRVYPKNTGEMWEPHEIWGGGKFLKTHRGSSRLNDRAGHYLWLICGHHHLPIVVMSGIAENGVLMWRGYIDEQPDIPTNKLYPGRTIWRSVDQDNAPLKYLFGDTLGGRAGYNASMLDYTTEAEAMERMKPFRPPGLSDADWHSTVMYARDRALKAHF